MIEPRLRVYEFRAFRLNPAERLLLRDDVPVSLTPKVFDTLVFLVENRGRLIAKDEFMKRLWPDTFVEEITLTGNISLLRRALKNGADNSNFIETVPKCGYRFTAAVTVRGEATPGPVLPGVGPPEPVVSPPEPVVSKGASETNGPGGPTGIVTSQATRGTRRWTAAAALFVVAVLVSVILYVKTSIAIDRPPGAPAIQSLAVLPFALLDATSDEALGIGMADALIIRLSNVKQLVIRPTRAVVKYARMGQDPVAAGHELQVDALLDGSVQTSGTNIRVSVRLIRVSDGTMLWGDTFDQGLTSLLAMQDSISERVARSLVVRLSGDERRLLSKHQTDNPSAYQAYLKGRYFWNKRTGEGFARAIGYFEQAVKEDPGYAAAYAGLADSYLLLAGYRFTPTSDTLPKARSSAEQALRLDETLADAHATLALVAQNGDWNWKEAEREYRRAIELNPNYATAHHWYGEFLALMGRPDEGIVEMKRALDLDPLSLAINMDLGVVFARKREYARAVDQFLKTIDMDPHFPFVHGSLASVYEVQGRYQEAMTEVRELLALEGNSNAEGLNGRLHASMGKRAEALQAIARLKALSTRQHVSPFDIASIYVRLGDKDQAFAWLEKEYREHTAQLIGLKVDAFYDSLRSDPRFDDLLRRMNF
jgi:DNA-binding winged helix-turn-helix (wHTH) protein/TolB-like protein/Tfp pilus assembly protein PilF